MSAGDSSSLEERGQVDEGRAAEHREADLIHGRAPLISPSFDLERGERVSERRGAVLDRPTPRRLRRRCAGPEGGSHDDDARRRPGERNRPGAAPPTSAARLSPSGRVTAPRSLGSAVALRAAPPWEPSRSSRPLAWQVGKLGVGRERLKLGGDLLREGGGLPDRSGCGGRRRRVDRVRLAEQVVGQTDLGVGVGAAELCQGTRARFAAPRSLETPSRPARSS